jgi:predicted transcriptional regulator
MAQTVIDIGIEDELLKLIKKIAKIQHRSKSEVIKDSIYRYAKSFLTMEELKKIAIEKYSNGDMNFDELARVIGYEEALTFQVGSKTIKESIELADKLFKD